jgi:hypothetical protein
MNPFMVVSERNLLDHLISLCYEPTKETTGTGTFWKSLKTGKHLLVPFPYEGMYPDFILKDLEVEIGKVQPSIQ